MAWETVVPNTARHPQLHPAEEIIEEIRAGRMVVLVDDEDRENEGDLVMAADAVTPEAINFMARYGRGLICLTLTQDKCRQLKLPLMVARQPGSPHTAFTVSIEAATGVTTGISAADRARTIATAVADDARPEDLVQPGHIFRSWPAGRGAGAGRSHRGRLRPACLGRSPTRRCDLRDSQRRRQHGPSAGPDPVAQTMAQAGSIAT